MGSRHRGSGVFTQYQRGGGCPCAATVGVSHVRLGGVAVLGADAYPQCPAGDGDGERAGICIRSLCRHADGAHTQRNEQVIAGGGAAVFLLAGRQQEQGRCQQDGGHGCRRAGDP
ncbi:hypothetical protein SFC43_13940 [Bacteroides sp. CR5/BHMF/2]|nr:hypothetical protein [Bacteroides sp. CR5/BHMF/2]